MILGARLAAAFALLTAAACSAGAGNDGAVSTANETAGSTPQTLTAIKGREWARCSFAVAGQSAQLSCTSTARGNDPLGASVTVSGGGVGGAFVGFAKTLDVEAGGTVIVTTVQRASFPVILTLAAKLDAASQSAIGLTNNVDFETTVTVNTPEDLPASSSAIVGQPFDLWPIGIVFALEHGGGLSVDAVPYKRSIAPYKDFLDNTDMALTPSIAQFDKKLHYVVAPASGPLAIAESLNGSDVATAIPGPGYFAITDAGMRAATPTEIATTFGGIAPTPSPAPSTDDAGAAPPSITPAPAVDPDPTCGGDRQARCEGAAKLCDDGNRWSSSDGTCVACGAAGQPYCFKAADNSDDSQGNRCDSGTRWSSSDATCVTCGGAGQLYCFKSADNFDDSQGNRCDAGTRWSSSDAACVTCGGAGQLYCFKSADNFDDSQGNRCDAGTRWSSSDATCVACGAANQTYCYVASDDFDGSQGNRCNDGLTIDDGLCVSP